MQLRFLKLAQGLRNTIATCMALGEVGRFPVETDVACRILSYWYKLHCDALNESNKLSSLLHKLCLRQQEVTAFNLPWLKYVHDTLDCLGLSYLKNTPLYTLHQFKCLVKQRVRDQFL